MNQILNKSFVFAALLSGACLTPAFGQSAVQPSVAEQSNGIIHVENAQLACLHDVEIAAQADGQINELLVEEGDTVEDGAMLLKIDDRVALAAVRVAEKELEAAERQASQTANLEYAKKASQVADEEYRAENEVFNRGASSMSQARRKLLEAERARLGIEVAEVEHEKEQLARDVSQAKLEQAQVQLSLYSVAAPYSGIIVKRMRDRGEWIRAGEPVLRLLHMDEMKITVDIPVDQASANELENAPMTVYVKANGQVFKIETTVKYVSPRIDFNSISITTYVQNQKQGNSWLLRDGMLAAIDIRPIRE